jgi:hypothetical protein
MLKTIGVIFPKSSQWHKDQIELMQSIGLQIEHKFPDAKNVLINMTWFGQQFENHEYMKFYNYYKSHNIDNLFLLASEDPCFYNRDETHALFKESGSKNLYLLGHFDSEPYSFNFHNIVLTKYFYPYTEAQLLMQEPRYIFVNYNRKPRDHRTLLVHMLDDRKLSELGIVTLGDDRSLNETVEDIGIENQWWDEAYGIPHDIHSLGRLNIWQNHFLTVVSETDYEDYLWTFITEKTWKPIIGLRPFLINGQSAVYKWLTDRGFKTFNKYWSHINLETCDIDDIHPNICSVIEFLQTQDLKQIYLDMLPDLRYNRERFYEFSREQEYKMEHIFA